MQKYGQHFLIDPRVITQIVDATLLLRAENIVEIGPGKGALTRALVARGVKNLTAVEIDPEMVSYLQQHLPAEGGVHIVSSNFLQFDWAHLVPGPTTFVSNLPYIDAAEILDKVLSWPHFQSAVFMFQKEQAQKIRAKTSEEFYGPLSIFSQLRARISPVCKAGRSCFAPPPKVESAVLAFEKITPPAVPWELLARVVKAAFLHRRKTLVNALTLGGFDKDRVEQALCAAGFTSSTRPEQVSPTGYVMLVKAWQNHH